MLSFKFYHSSKPAAHNSSHKPRKSPEWKNNHDKIFWMNSFIFCVWVLNRNMIKRFKLIVPVNDFICSYITWSYLRGIN